MNRDDWQRLQAVTKAYKALLRAKTGDPRAIDEALRALGRYRVPLG